MTIRRLTVNLALSFVLCGTPALAQHAEPTAVASAAAVPLTAAQRSAAIDAILSAVDRRYVFPERAPAIRERLTGALVEGRYDVSDPQAFAEQVSTDLRESSNDGHMYLTHNPTQYAAALTSDEDIFENPAMQAIWASAERRANGGLSEMRILPGNIRYLKINQFHWVSDRTGLAYDSAMRFLRDGDAVIIDLRGNGGGEHAGVRYLLSHFMKPDTLDITFLEAGKEPVQSRTLDQLPAGRLIGKPLYVLTDRAVGSAAEAFAYDVQQFRLGSVVGAVTGGAANNNEFMPIAPGFMLSVSYGRPVHPVSGGNWEGIGVKPDVETDPANALNVAMGQALQTLLDGQAADPVDRAGWMWAQIAVEAGLNPVTIPAERLGVLAGTYDGREIVLERGMLVWLSSTGQRRALLPLTADGLFAVEGNDRLRLRLDGQALELHRLESSAPTRIPRD